MYVVLWTPWGSAARVWVDATNSLVARIVVILLARQVGVDARVSLSKCRATGNFELLQDIFSDIHCTSFVCSLQFERASSVNWGHEWIPSLLCIIVAIILLLSFALQLILAQVEVVLNVRRRHLNWVLVHLQDLDVLFNTLLGGFVVTEYLLLFELLITLAHAIWFTMRGLTERAFALV